MSALSKTRKDIFSETKGMQKKLVIFSLNKLRSKELYLFFVDANIF